MLVVVGQEEGSQAVDEERAKRLNSSRARFTRFPQITPYSEITQTYYGKQFYCSIHTIFFVNQKQRKNRHER